MKRRLIIGLVLFLCMVLPFATPALAIADPSTMTINGVWVYHHCLETDDQLYIIDYTITYGSVPTENITQAFICRLLNGSTELRAVAPYSYFNKGYNRGVIAIYFDAADAPTWNQAYTMELVGNPSLSWAGDPPSTSVTSFDLWSSSVSINVSQIEVASRILTLANDLEFAWSYDMIESTPIGNRLTMTYGEPYFTNVIQYAKNIAPSAFETEFYNPDFTRREFSYDYADDLADDAAGTPLDVSDAATELGVSTMSLSTILYLGVVVALLIFIVGITRNMKGVLAIALPLVALGALWGVIPLAIAIIMGFVALFVLGYVIFYRSANA